MARVLAQDLRNAVLQAAIQGRLTVQLSTDSAVNMQVSPVGDTESKSKKRKNAERHLPGISENDMSIEIPQNWKYCRVGELVNSIDAGKSPNCKNEASKEDEWGVIKTTAIQDNYFVESENKILPKTFEIKEKYIIHKNDFLITRAGPRNRTGVICIVDKEPNHLILSDKTLRFNLKNELILPEYLRIALRSPFGQSNIENFMVGMASSQVNISQDNMKLFVIPLPPIEEQARIVARVDKLMAKIDEYEKIEKDLVELHKVFPGNMKDAILQAAMQGKLTDQLGSDSLVSKDLTYYEDTDGLLPDSWRYACLKETASVLYGYPFESSQFNTVNNGMPLLRIRDILPGKTNTYTTEVVSEEYIITKGDMVVGMDGNFNVRFWNSENAYLNQRVCKITADNKNLLQRYLYYYLPIYLKEISSNVSYVTVKHLSDKHLSSLLIPLPPIEEQQRIIDKLDRLLPLCDQLEQMVK